MTAQSAAASDGLRPVLDADSAALIELIGQTWAEYPGVVLDVDAEEPWMRAPATAFASWDGAFWVLPRPGSRRLDACVGVRPAPTGAAEPSRAAELKSLYVAAPARRRGYGARLVRHVEQWARERGMQRVELWSDTRFADAHRLYQRLGYIRTGRRRELHDLSQSSESEFVATLARVRGTYPRP